MEEIATHTKERSIQFVGTLELTQTDGNPPVKKLTELFNGTGRRIVRVALGAGEVLTKHMAQEPISVLCLSGSGVFSAGEALDDVQELVAGTLITLDAEVPHEVTTAAGVRLLVTKFKKY